MLASGAAQGEEPDESETELAVDATVAHIGGSACALALVALEDLLGLPEQPNFPSLLNKHPNWRRRLPYGNGLRDEHVRRRLRILQDRRKKSKP
jgi:4-alpha-glucanotransferase